MFKKKIQKLAGLWLAGEVVNHVGIYGSKAAEGLSAFQRRSCFTYITWVKILHGIEYQRPTSLNMRILADHVTYSFLAFPKSIF